MEYGYIYKTTNLINGRIYIGQNKGTMTSYYLGSGKAILRAIKKYGKENFRLEVLAFATTKEMLDGLEMKHIYEYRQVFGKEFLYNITDGGEGTRGFVHPPEILEKIASKLRGRKNPQVSEARKGKHNSPQTEFKEGKIASANTQFKKGFIPWNKGIKRTDNAGARHYLFGKKISEEVRMKMRRPKNKTLLKAKT